jgi:hypothetical protein
MSGACSIHGRNACKISTSNLKGGDNLEDLGVDVRVVLEFMLNRRVWGCK